MARKKREAVIIPNSEGLLNLEWLFWAPARQRSKYFITLELGVWEGKRFLHPNPTKVPEMSLLWSNWNRILWHNVKYKILFPCVLVKTLDILLYKFLGTYLFILFLWIYVYNILNFL